MSIDRQRFAAAQKLQELGYRWEGGEWVKPHQPLKRLDPFNVIVNNIVGLEISLKSAGLNQGPRTIQLYSDLDYRRLEAMAVAAGCTFPTLAGQRTSKPPLSIAGIAFDYDIPF